MNPQEQTAESVVRQAQPEARNKKYVAIIIVFAIIAIGGIVFGGIELWQNMQAKKEIDSLNNAISVQTTEDEQPQFNDYYAEAMFIYSWFMDNATLLKYSNMDSEYDEYQILNLYGMKTIDDMKQRAYKVFDKAFVDARINQKLSEGLLKQGDNVVLVHDGAVGLTNVYDGYAYHKTTPLDDGGYLYTVHFNNLSDNMGIYNGCEGGDYDFIYEKNPDGTFSFKEFASLIELCRQQK